MRSETPTDRPVLRVATAPPPGTVRHRAPRRRRQVTGYTWLIFVVLGVVAVVVLTMLPSAPPTVRHRTVVASLPYWNMPGGAATVLANRADFTAASPWMYGLDASGRIVPQYDSGQQAPMAAALRRLRAAHMPIVPTLANVTQGAFAYQAVGRILHTPSLLRAHVAAIAALVRQQGYAGIDIDYENLRAADRQAFSGFVTSLAAALHAEGKTLSVAVFAKITDAGYDQRNIAQDYAAIGRAADEVRLMCYDYHWATSPPGPVAPIWWVRGVIRYAKSQIPASKIILGVPLYGYDWVSGPGHHGSTVSWLRAFQLATSHKARPRFDPASQTPWFGYTDRSGRQHEVWFENTQSSTAKFAAAQGSGIGGAYLWMYGYEETSTWPALRQALPISWKPAAGRTAGQPSGGNS